MSVDDEHYDDDAFFSALPSLARAACGWWILMMDDDLHLISYWLLPKGWIHFIFLAPCTHMVCPAGWSSHFSCWWMETTIHHWGGGGGKDRWWIRWMDCGLNGRGGSLTSIHGGNITVIMGWWSIAFYTHIFSPFDGKRNDERRYMVTWWVVNSFL